MDDFDILVQQGGMLIRIEALELSERQQKSMQVIAIEAYNDTINQAFDEVRQIPRDVDALAAYRDRCDTWAKHYWKRACEAQAGDPYFHYAMSKHVAWLNVWGAVEAASFGKGWQTQWDFRF